MSPIRVAVRADYPAVRAGLVALLREAGHDAFEDVEGAPPDLLDERVDVVVVDLEARQREERPEDIPAVYLVDARDAVVDVHDRAPAALLRRDASADELDAAVRAVVAGLAVRDPSIVPGERVRRASGDGTRTPLTAREVEVLRLLAAGMTNRGAAHTLRISEHTVKFHVGSVLSKLGAHSRAEAVSIATRQGLLPL